MRFLTVFLAITFLKLIINFYYFFLTKYYLRKYTEYIQGGGWFVSENRQNIIKLFRNANVDDSTLSNVQPAGFGLIATGNASVYQNMQIRREDIVQVMLDSFHEASGVYKTRLTETFSPIFWIEFVLHFPTKVLVYLGLSDNSFVTKLTQVLWNIFLAISTLIQIIINNDFANWIQKITNS